MWIIKFLIQGSIAEVKHIFLVVFLSNIHSYSLSLCSGQLCQVAH